MASTFVDQLLRWPRPLQTILDRATTPRAPPLHALTATRLTGPLVKTLNTLVQSQVRILQITLNGWLLGRVTRRRFPGRAFMAFLRNMVSSFPSRVTPWYRERAQLEFTNMNRGRPPPSCPSSLRSLCYRLSSTPNTLTAVPMSTVVPTGSATTNERRLQPPSKNTSTVPQNMRIQWKDDPQASLFPQRSTIEGRH